MTLFQIRLKMKLKKHAPIRSKTIPIPKINRKSTFARWFRKLIIKRGLQSVLEIKLQKMPRIIFRPEIRESLEYDTSGNIQQLTVYYIAPISPGDVSFSPWNELRLLKIASWANQQTLNRIYVDAINNQALNLSELPVISRNIDPDGVPPKYAVANGIHRFAHAAKMNIPTVLSLVADTVIIREEWVRKILPELEISH